MVVLAFNPSIQQDGSLSVRPLYLQSELQDNRNPVLKNEFLWLQLGSFLFLVSHTLLLHVGFAFGDLPRACLQ